MKDYTGATIAKFLFEYMLTMFGYPKVMMSDHGTHFLKFNDQRVDKIVPSVSS